MVSISRRSLALMALIATFVFPVARLKAAASADPKAMVDGLVRQALALIRDLAAARSRRSASVNLLFL